MIKLNHHPSSLINRSGFTLVEVIVVLLILSVLGSFAIKKESFNLLRIGQLEDEIVSAPLIPN